MDREKGFQLTEFEVARAGERTERVRAIRHRMRNDRETQERRVEARSMVLKIAICTVALFIVIALEVFLLSSPDEKAVSAASEQDGSAGAEDALGKLKFVSLNEAKSVFSINQRWSSPVIATESALLNQDQLLKLSAAAGDRISLPAAGEVKELFTDETLGSGIRISHGNGLESVYYGVSDIRVEKGQPLIASDTLGLMPESGEIYVAVYQSGTALCPTDIIDPAAAGA